MGSKPTKPIKYMVPIQNKDKKENETFIYRHPKTVNYDLFNFEEDIKTLHDVYIKRFKLEDENEPCIGRRERNMNGELFKKVHWYSNRIIFQNAEHIGSGILNLGLTKEITEWNNYTLKFVGVYSRNSKEYLELDIGCCMYDITSVPIYDTLGEKATQFAFDQTKMITCFVTKKHVKKILNAKINDNLY